MEGVSELENCSRCNAEVPKKEYLACEELCWNCFHVIYEGHDGNFKDEPCGDPDCSLGKSTSDGGLKEVNELKIKEAMKKDFNIMFQEGFCTDWESKRFYMEIYIDTMSIENLVKLFKGED